MNESDRVVCVCARECAENVSAHFNVPIGNAGNAIHRTWHVMCVACVCIVSDVDDSSVDYNQINDYRIA